MTTILPNNVHHLQTNIFTVVVLNENGDEGELLPFLKFNSNQFHPDDTILDIKYEISNAFQLNNQIIPVEDMHLFCQSTERLDIAKMFDVFSLNGEEIDDRIISNYYQSLQLEQKNSYSLSDFLKLKETTFIASHILGYNTIFNNGNSIPLVASPTLWENNDTISFINHANSKTFMNSNILNNTIYLCLKQNYDDNNLLRQYFPDINQRKRSNSKYQHLQTMRQRCHHTTNFEKGGITKFKFSIHPIYTDVTLGLENMFKTNHATESIPLLKYNPQVRRENIYRLYTKDKKKEIPFLKKPLVADFMRNVGNTTTSISFYSSCEIGHIHCILELNGIISVEIFLKKETDLQNIENIVTTKVNQLFQEMQISVVLSSLNDANITIDKMEYEMFSFIEKDVKMDSLLKKFKHIFVVDIPKKVKREITTYYLRFIRVSDYEEDKSLSLPITVIVDKQHSKITMIASKLDHLKYIEVMQCYFNAFIYFSQLRATHAQITQFVGGNNDEHNNNDDNIYDDNIYDDNIYDDNIYDDNIYDDDDNNTDTNDEKKNRVNKNNAIEIPDDENEESESDDKKSESNNKESEFDSDEFISDDEESLSNEHYEQKGGSNLFDDDYNNDDLIFHFQDVDDHLLQEIENSDSEVFDKFSEAFNPVGIDTILNRKDEDDDNNEADNNEEENDDNEDIEVVNEDVEDENEENDDVNNDTEMTDFPEFVREHKLRDKDNIKLNLPYYFQERIEKLDGDLVIKNEKEHPGFKSYSRTCKSSDRRQPVIVSDRELQRIQNTYESFDENIDVLKYGSKREKQYNYICPRYWCLKTNKMIDASELTKVRNPITNKNELQHKTCGKVLPLHETKTKKGYYIYDFGRKRRHPSLQMNKHPTKGVCLPCCFQNGPKIERNKEQHFQEEKEQEEEEEDGVAQPNRRKTKITNEKFILNPEKFPLPEGRWGYMSMELQMFFQANYLLDQRSKSNTSLKIGKPCLLRHGVEKSQQQSFVACIADTYFYYKYPFQRDLANKMSVSDMRLHIQEFITLDTFVQYQKGNLVQVFADYSQDVDIESYLQTSNVLQILDINGNENDRIHAQKIVSAFENFKEYLISDKENVEFDYLWDIVCLPNEHLFTTGVNLIIFELKREDGTSNVSIICPASHNALSTYDNTKPSLLLVKINNQYEPIYLYTQLANNKFQLETIFFENNEYIEGLFINIIEPFFNQSCKSASSVSNALSLDKLLELLTQYYKKLVKIKSLVMNYNNRIIGVVVEEKQTNKRNEKNKRNRVLVPCHPSTVPFESEYPIISFSRQGQIWSSFQTSVKLLKKISNHGDGQLFRIPCKPLEYVVDDKYVVGIMTQTNQMIQTEPPISVLHHRIEVNRLKQKYGLKERENSNYIAADTSIALGKLNPREDRIFKLQLEEELYGTFTQMIKEILDLKKYKSKKIDLMQYSDGKNNSNSNTEKKQYIEQFLDDISSPYVITADDDIYMDALIQCRSNQTKEECDENKYDRSTDDDAKLILPNNNSFIQKLSNEIVLNKKFREYFFQSNALVAGVAATVRYSVYPDEMLLTETNLVKLFHYTRKSKKNKENTDVDKNALNDGLGNVFGDGDNGNVDDGNVEDGNDAALDEPCDEIILSALPKRKIRSTYLVKEFPQYLEMEYVPKTGLCSFEFMRSIINYVKNMEITIQNLKDELIYKYSITLANKYETVLLLWKQEGKLSATNYQSLMNNNDNGVDFAESIKNILQNNAYFISTNDFWILMETYGIPTLFISSEMKTKLLQTFKKDNKFITINNGSLYLHVIVPKTIKNTIPKFKILCSKVDNNKIMLPFHKKWQYIKEKKQTFSTYIIENK
jgi:hypothetical protein